MLLSDQDILQLHWDEDDSLIEPLDVARLQPASYDVTLARGAKKISPQYLETAWDPFVLDPTNVPEDYYYDFAGDRIFLESGEFALISIQEKITLPADVAARVEGKSSLGRLGLAIHCTAGFIDPGFSGQITLEAVNLSPIPMGLPVGMKIGQLCFFELTSESLRPYGHEALGSRYQDQKGVTASKGVSLVNEYWNKDNVAA